VWFVRKRHSAETEAAIFAAFPAFLGDGVRAVLDFLKVAPHEPHVDAAYRAVVCGQDVVLPCRVYFPAVRPENAGSLTDRQRAILSALMSRHHDGHQRELWARVLCSHPAEWSVPFIAFLLGDYVIQVLRAVDESLTSGWTELFDSFIAENGIERRPLNHRILNYWTLYYRYHGPNIRKLTDYPGYAVAKRLGLWDNHTAPKLLRKAMRKQSDRA